MNIIAFDIEATENKEMLELSVFNFPKCNEIYHSYFCPPFSNHWSEKIHHISNIDVCDAPTVKEEKSKIQKILNDADVIIGHSINNDIKYLQIDGFEIPKGIILIDTQKYMSVLENGTNDIQYGKQYGLQRCAEIMGCGFSSELHAHSATNDTIVTLRLLNSLIKKYCQVEPSEEALQELDAIVTEKERPLKRLYCKGYISLKRKTNGSFSFVQHANKPEKAEYFILVEDRKKALMELQEQFTHRQVKPNIYLYKLTKDDITAFLSYTNTYDDEELNTEFMDDEIDETEDSSCEEITDNAPVKDNSPADLSALQALQAKFSRR